MQWIDRWCRRELLASLQSHRVVSVTGCRQSGKTTLVRHAGVNAEYRTLDSSATLTQASEDPVFFVRRRPGTCLIIDEVQKLPLLIGEIKCRVDENSEESGQYIITGSADYRKLPQASESLAGRVNFVRVRTFAEAELRGRPPVLLERLFKGQMPYGCTFDDCNKRLIVDLAVKGGFPAVQRMSADDRARWFRSYLQQQVLLDMRGQWKTKRSDQVEDMFRLIAAYSSKPLVVRNVSRQLNAAWATVEKYYSAIEAMFLADTVSAWTLKDYDRPGKTPKVFMTDSGLMAHLLGIGDGVDVFQQEFAQNYGGKLVETWAYNQLMPEIELHPRWRLQHFRSKSHEIDFVVTNEKDELLLIDIKSGESVNGDDFQHIRWLKEQLGGKKTCTGIVLYAGNEVRSAGGGCYAVPFAAMWQESMWK